MAHEIFLFSEQLGLSVMGLKEIAAAKHMINQLREVPLGLVLVTLALVPARV